MRLDLSDVLAMLGMALFSVGLVLVAVGISWINPAAGMIAAGVEAAVVGWALFRHVTGSA